MPNNDDDDDVCVVCTSNRPSVTYLKSSKIRKDVTGGAGWRW